MASSVRKSVQYRKASPVASDDIIRFIIVRLSDVSEQTLWQGRLGRQNIFNTPWGVQRFHYRTLMTQAGNVKAAVSFRNARQKNQLYKRLRACQAQVVC